MLLSVSFSKRKRQKVTKERKRVVSFLQEKRDQKRVWAVHTGKIVIRCRSCLYFVKIVAFSSSKPTVWEANCVWGALNRVRGRLKSPCEAAVRVEYQASVALWKAYAFSFSPLCFVSLVFLFQKEKKRNEEKY